MEARFRYCQSTADGSRSSNTLQRPNDRGFAFYGVADGIYDVVAQQLCVPGSAPDIAFSDGRRITVKGADVTGLELTTKPLASLSGTIACNLQTQLNVRVSVSRVWRRRW